MLVQGSTTKLELCGLHRLFLASPCTEALTPPRTLTPHSPSVPGERLGPRFREDFLKAVLLPFAISLHLKLLTF